MTTNAELPVVVIGAGPVGLAAAAHLALRRMPFLVLECGSGPAAAMAEWGHVTIFSPWRFNVDCAARELLEAAGWRLDPADDDRDPTGHELIERYLAPLAALPRIVPFVRYGAHVRSVTRLGMDLVPEHGRFDQPFEITHAGPGGSEQRVLARAVIDASGTWLTPNPAGSSGVPAEGERAAARHVATGIPDVLGRARSRYAGRRVAVIGSGHSAMDALLDLARLRREAPGTEIVWVMRRAPTEKTFGGGEDDQLASRGALGARAKLLVDRGEVAVVAPFRTVRFSFAGDQVVVTGDGPDGQRSVTADEVVVATGFRPDLSMLSELRLELDPSVQAPRVLAPLIDPNFHSCGDVPPHGYRQLAHPERDFFIVGMKSYGRAPTFLMATGYEQVRSVVAALAGDMAAADDVRLALPATGVCEGIGHAREELPAAACCAPGVVAEKVRVTVTADVAAGCCGGPAIDDSSACCVADSHAKEAGRSGCGCQDRLESDRPAFGAAS